MQFIPPATSPRELDLSIVLVDWSCRESFHLLDQLARQSWPRGQFEVIWIEFYDAQPEGIAARLSAGAAAGAPPPIDRRLLLEMPRDVPHHKHLMYNAGLALAGGRIVCIADSDMIVSPTFVESIVRAFEGRAEMVLHLDQVRNVSRRLYRSPLASDPEAIRGLGCINWVNRRPLGLSDLADPLHTRNYGACMAARRQDLLAIGGADEHEDYLGHICGPYEMTFRLVNRGLAEVWHEQEWTYHLWHPGQDGAGEIIGPHDGRHMALRALEARASGRVEPLLENPAIGRLRRGQAASVDELLAALVEPARVERWRRLGRDRRRLPVEDPPVRPRSPEQVGLRLANDARLDPAYVRTVGTAANDAAVAPGEGVSVAPAAAAPGGVPMPLGRLTKLRLALVLVGMLAGQVVEKLKVRWRTRRPVRRGKVAALSPFSQGQDGPAQRPFGSDTHSPYGRDTALGRLRAFLGRAWEYDRHVLRQCRLAVSLLAQRGGRTIFVFGAGRLPGIIKLLAASARIAVAPLPDDPPLPSEVPAGDEPVLVAALADVDRQVAALLSAGVERARIWTLD